MTYAWVHTQEDQIGPRSQSCLIICTRNRPRDLKRALTATLMCEDRPSLILVVDSSDTDESERLVEAIGSVRGVELVHMASSPGLTHQRNIGLDAVPEGIEIVFFIDDDCIPCSGYFSGIEGVYRQESDAVGVGAHVSHTLLKDEGKRAGRVWAGFARLTFLRPMPGRVSRAGIGRPADRAPQRPMKVDWLSGGAMSFNASAAVRTRFDEEQFHGYSAGEDLDFSLRVSQLGQLYLAPRVSIEHRHSGSSRLRPRHFSRETALNRYKIVQKNPSLNSGAYWISLLARSLGRVTARDWESLLGIWDAATQILARKRGQSR